MVLGLRVPARAPGRAVRPLRYESQGPAGQHVDGILRLRGDQVERLVRPHRRLALGLLGVRIAAADILQRVERAQKGRDLADLRLVELERVVARGRSAWCRSGWRPRWFSPSCCGRTGPVSAASTRGAVFIDPLPRKLASMPGTWNCASRSKPPSPGMSGASWRASVLVRLAALVAKFRLKPASLFAPALVWQKEHARLTPTPLNRSLPACTSGLAKLIVARSRSACRPRDSWKASRASSSSWVGRRKSVRGEPSSAGSAGPWRRSRTSAASRRRAPRRRTSPWR